MIDFFTSSSADPVRDTDDLKSWARFAAGFPKTEFEDLGFWYLSSPSMRGRRDSGSALFAKHPPLDASLVMPPSRQGKVDKFTGSWAEFGFFVGYVCGFWQVDYSAGDPDPDPDYGGMAPPLIEDSSTGSTSCRIADLADGTEQWITADDDTFLNFFLASTKFSYTMMHPNDLPAPGLAG